MAKQIVGTARLIFEALEKNQDSIVVESLDRLLNASSAALKLEALLQSMKTLHGEKWNEVSEPYRAVLNGVMKSESCSVLAAAIPIAKRMVAEGVSPLMLMSVAAEMCLEHENASAATSDTLDADVGNSGGGQ